MGIILENQGAEKLVKYNNIHAYVAKTAMQESE